MQETQKDLQRLQTLIDQSIAQAGGFLRKSLQMPEKSLSAEQLVRYLQGIKVVAMASVTAKGEPRVAPVGSLFYRSRFYIPTVATAARTRHLLKRPAASLTHYLGVDLAIIVHGRAALLPADHADFATLDDLHHESAGNSVQDWGEGVYLRIDADTLYTFARHPERYPG